MIGNKFGRWTVEAEAGRGKHREKMYKCHCECGTVRNVRGVSLRNGKSKSCGCLHLEGIPRNHGMRHTRFYNIWSNMKTRCQNEDFFAFQDYGGRGIKVCDGWQTFESFKEDMYEAYQKHIEEHGEEQTTLERIDVNGNYEPSNCMWATRGEQAINRRRRVDNTSGKTGVYWHSNGKTWKATISINGKRKHLGSFTDFDMAVKARKDAEAKYHGKSSIAKSEVN